jgi:beta-glucosidase-like glycosyl hydrolase
MAIKYKAESAEQNKTSLTSIRTKLTLATEIDKDSMNEMLARMEAMSSAAIEAGVDESLVSQYNALYENLSELAPESGKITGVYAEWLTQAGELEVHIANISEA